MARLERKNVLLTGGTSGIGFASARALARLGFSVTVTGRDPARGEAAVAALRDETGNPDIALLLGDLTSRQGVEALARGWRARGRALDVLVHNAGLMPGALQRSEDGLETGFAVNVAAPLRLTRALEASLSARARVVSLTGGEHPSRLELDNLQGERRFVALSLYSHHKLVMMATMRELARRMSGSGRTVNVCYPGQASTAMTRAVRATDLPPAMRLFYPIFRWLTRDDGGRSAERASRATVHLASSPALEGVTGRYFDTNARERAWPKAIADDATCRAVWDLVAPLAGVDGPWP